MNPLESIQKYTLKENIIDTYANTLTEIVKLTRDNLEGNCFTNHQTTERNEKLRSKRINIFAAASHGPRILEVGFNAGHSALLLQLGCLPHSIIDIVDIGGHPYVLPCFEYLNSINTISKSLVLIDSREYLAKRVLKEKEHDIYDLIHMDGGHYPECVVSDLIFLYQLLKPGGWIIVDDAEGFILQECERFIRLGLFKKVEGQLPTEVYPHLLLEKIN